jgi:nucleoid-associated protein YgaU
VWDELRYKVGTAPEDQSLAALSKHFYFTDRYAAALLQYNRDHHLGDDALKRNPPVLTPGTTIWVPQLEALKGRYSNLEGASVPSGGVAVPVVSAEGQQRPAPVVPGSPGPASPAAVPVVSGPPADPTPVPVATPPGTAAPVVAASPAATAAKWYTVRPEGQYYSQIARETLGDGGRWADIYHLNPAIAPEQPIPGGTRIRLPADAKVWQ